MMQPANKTRLARTSARIGLNFLIGFGLFISLSPLRSKRSTSEYPPRRYAKAWTNWARGSWAVPPASEIVLAPSATGSRQGIRAPGPEADAMKAFPPDSSMRLLTRERPRPVLVCRTPRSNFSYTRARSACGMPAPVSATVSNSASFWRTASTVIAPPGGVNLIEFEIRLKSACLIRRSSPSIAPISGGKRSSSSRSRLRALAGQRHHGLQHPENLDAPGFEHHVACFDRGEI